MTYARREAILSQESISIEELGELLGIKSYQMAAKVMRDIKRKYDSLNVQGRLHVSDYFKYFNIPMEARYLAKPMDEQEAYV